MGIFEANLRIANPSAPTRTSEIALMVDTGATLTAIPDSVLRSLGVSPVTERTFIVANDDRIRRRTGSVLATLDGITMPITVVFAENEDTPVLGATALEILGFAVDPVEKKLMPRDLLALSLREH